MSYRGKVKNSLVPCTCMMRSLLAIRVDPSFFNISKLNVTKNVRLASTLIIIFYFFILSSSSLG